MAINLPDMKLLLTGAHGMLGKDLADLFTAKGYEVVKTDRAELDITDRDAVLAFVRTERPDVIINAAAYNFVDKVEDDQFYPIAYAVNAEGPRNLAEAAKDIGVKFVHYSTDYVFAGDKPEGYSEADVPAPISRYGETKAAGERMVQEVGGDYYICRTSKIFGKPGLSEESKVSFVALMLSLAEKLPEMKIVDEEVGCPTYTPDIAATTLVLLEGEYVPGVYHVVNGGEGVTWFQFANEIFAAAGIDPVRKPVPSSEFPRAASAPKFAPLLNTKLPPLRHRKEALAEFLSRERLGE